MAMWVAQQKNRVTGEWSDTTGNQYDDELPKGAAAISLLSKIAEHFNESEGAENFRVAEVTK